MEYVYIGKLVNTHGLKGEVRIISDFKYKSLVFLTNNTVYINDTKYVISSHRIHKMYDLVTFDGLKSIDDVLNLKGYNVYIKKDEYEFPSYLDEELIGFKVYDKDICKGTVVDILKGEKYSLLLVSGKREHMVPNIKEFIDSIDFDKKCIYVNYIKGLDCED